MYNSVQLNEMILPELQDVAVKLKIKGADKLEKEALVKKILAAQTSSETPAAEEEVKVKKPRARKPIAADLKGKTEDKPQEEISVTPVEEKVEEVKEKAVEPAQQLTLEVEKKPEPKPIVRPLRPDARQKHKEQVEKEAANPGNQQETTKTNDTTTTATR
jgi:transcription termination factor Rho